MAELRDEKTRNMSLDVVGPCHLPRGASHQGRTRGSLPGHMTGVGVMLVLFSVLLTPQDRPSERRGSGERLITTITASPEAQARQPAHGQKGEFMHHAQDLRPS